MKCLLLPLLTALALPTAVNANWFSGDIVVKNYLGEKTIVKKETVSIGNKYDIGWIKNILKNRGDYRRERAKEYLKKYEDTDSEFYLELSNDASYKARVADGSWEKVKYIFERVDEELIASIKIKYTPIFEDINGIKKVLPAKNIACTNPELDYTNRGFLKYLHNYPPDIKYENLDDVSEKVCDKYAKF